MQHDAKLRLAVTRGVIIVAMLTSTVGLVGATNIPTTSNQPTYQHSWYVQTPTTAGMDNIALKDASWANNHCPPSNVSASMLTILDFGQAYNTSSGDTTYDFGNNFDSSTVILQAVEEYAFQWFQATSSCPQLYLAIGTSNYNECAGGGSSGSCVYTFGYQWGQLINSLQNWLHLHGYTIQINAWGASDMEVEWDTYSQTVNFINGFTNFDAGNSYKPLLVDFGDGTTGSSGVWTEQNVYQAAWGDGWDIPDPEIYHQYQVTQWTTIEQDSKTHNWGAGIMQIYSLMSECEGPDPYPTGSCWVWRAGLCEISPTQAWNDLNPVVLSTSLSNLLYATDNIYQNDTPQYRACP